MQKPRGKLTHKKHKFQITSPQKCENLPHDRARRTVALAGLEIGVQHPAILQGNEEGAKEARRKSRPELTCRVYRERSGLVPLCIQTKERGLAKELKRRAAPSVEGLGLGRRVSEGETNP